MNADVAAVLIPRGSQIINSFHILFATSEAFS